MKHGSVALAVLTFYAAPLLLAVAAPLVLPERWSARRARRGDGRRRRHRADRARRRRRVGVRVGRRGGARVGGDVRRARRALEAAPARRHAAADGRVLGLLRGRARRRAGAPARRQGHPDGRRRMGGDPRARHRPDGRSRRSSTSMLLRHVSAQAAGVLTFLEPVAGVLLAWALVSEEPGPWTLAGGALVLAAGLVVVLLEPSETRVADAPGGIGSSPVSADPARTPPDRNLALELVRVTEAAAMGASRWIGRGDKNAADQAAVDLMRLMVNTVSMRGVVVIGEGEKDEAPMLFNGEEIGDGDGPAGRRCRRPARGDPSHGARHPRRDLRDRRRRARLDVLPRRGRLHGQDRRRARGRGRDRHRALADGERRSGSQRRRASRPTT